MKKIGQNTLENQEISRQEFKQHQMLFDLFVRNNFDGKTTPLRIVRVLHILVLVRNIQIINGAKSSKVTSNIRVNISAGNVSGV